MPAAPNMYVWVSWAAAEEAESSGNASKLLCRQGCEYRNLDSPPENPKASWRWSGSNGQNRNTVSAVYSNLQANSPNGILLKEALIQHRTFELDQMVRSAQQRQTSLSHSVFESGCNGAMCGTLPIQGRDPVRRRSVKQVLPK